MYSFVPLIAVLVISNSAFINARSSFGSRSGNNGCHGPIFHRYPTLYQSESIGKNNPEYIEYVPPNGGPAVKYIVYTGPTPSYVNRYKSSGSKYGTLLAGLALLNLGHLSVTRVQRRPLPNIGEVCLFGVQIGNGEFEEMVISCMLVTSFIYLDDANRLVAETSTSAALVLKEATVAAERPAPGPAAATVVDALDVVGPPVTVTRGMMCYVRTLERKSIPCEVLQTLGTRL